MKKLFFITGCFLLLSAFVIQESDYSESVRQHRNERNEEMKDSLRSPLKPEEIKKFKELNFFAIDESYKVKAKFIRNKKKEKIDMKTSAQKQKFYNVYGKVVFTLKEKEYSLNVYQSIDLMQKKEYKDYLFIPFTDNTNGNETYGGGRYIDLKIPGSKEIIIDFNLCYNPYCAYTTGYNCPIPPQENHLNTEIIAGEKKLWDDH